MARQYDLVLFGASGYTGRLTAQYIASHMPTDVKWAIAGRSESKLEALAEVCKSLNADQKQPAIEVCNLDHAEIGDLARKTTLLISTVGPFFIYGEYAFKACAENGTNYLDCTGESPWVLRMINKYEKAAKTTGAIMIPQIGLESTPPDLLTWSLVSLIRNKLSAPTGQVIFSLHNIKAHVSGGSISTVLNLLDYFPLSELNTANKPFALSPIPGPKSSSSQSFFNKIFGVRNVPGLGLLTTSLQAPADTPIVQRSWGVLGGSKLYGPNFHYQQYQRTSNYLTGIAIHVAFTVLSVMLAITPLRWIAKLLVIAPGDGATPEQTVHDFVEYRGIAYPDLPAKRPRAYCEARYNGSMYEFTALTMTQAAITLMKDDVVAKKFGGGILTPATLGQPFIDRLNEAGFKIETKLLDD